jgi:hypothetical protein
MIVPRAELVFCNSRRAEITYADLSCVNAYVGGLGRIKNRSKLLILLQAVFVIAVFLLVYDRVAGSNVGWLRRFATA